MSKVTGLKVFAIVIVAVVVAVATAWRIINHIDEHFVLGDE